MGPDLSDFPQHLRFTTTTQCLEKPAVLQELFVFLKSAQETDLATCL